MDEFTSHSSTDKNVKIVKSNMMIEIRTPTHQPVCEFLMIIVIAVYLLKNKG